MKHDIMLLDNIIFPCQVHSDVVKNQETFSDHYILMLYKDKTFNPVFLKDFWRIKADLRD